MSVRAAELNNDPLFKKLRKLQAAVKKIKAKIAQRYGSAGKSATNKILSGGSGD